MAIFDSFAADGAFGVFKELNLSASLVLTENHHRSAAGVAPFASGKGLAVAERTDGDQVPSAPGADKIPALDLLQTVRTMIPERAAAGTFGTDTAVPLDHFPAMNAGLFVCGHSLPSFHTIVFLFENLKFIANHGYGLCLTGSGVVYAQNTQRENTKPYDV